MNPNAHIYTDYVSCGYKESQHITEDYDLHCHNYYEVYYFFDGDADYLVEGRKYEPAPDSLLLLSPHVFHGVKINSSRPYQRFSVHFRPNILSLERRSFLLSAFPSPEKYSSRIIYYEQTKRFHIRDCFEMLEDCAMKSEKMKEQLLPIYIESLLSRIVSMYDAFTDASDRTLNPVSEIIWYLNRHLKEDISLDQLSERFFISKHHLNKVFRKATGTTVFDYLLHKRVANAQLMLINGSSAQESALASGFRDYSSFYRAYMRILGHSPLKDRGCLPSLSASAALELEEVGSQ